jgi:hypothetical protein
MPGMARTNLMGAWQSLFTTDYHALRSHPMKPTGIRLYQNPPHPATAVTTKRNRSAEFPNQLHIHGPAPHRENSANQNLSGRSTPRPAGLSPIEIRDAYCSQFA